MIKRYSSLLIDLLFIALILFIVYYVMDYHFGRYFLAGDFRLHIDKNHISEYFTHIFSTRFSVNTFMYIPFYSLFLVLQLIPYQLVLVLIFFGIPIALYLSMKTVLFMISEKRPLSWQLNLFLSSLAFYYAINPALFDRYVHFTILYGAIFFPLYLLCFYRYLRSKAIFNKYLFATPVLLFFGNVTPQLFVLYVSASVLLFIISILTVLKKDKYVQLIKKGVLLALLCLITLLHIITPIFSGFLITKSLHESSTTEAILMRLSDKSNIISSISGTHQFNALLEFPVIISSGLIIFVLFLLTAIKKKAKYRNDLMLLVGTSILLVILVGYGTFPKIYQIIEKTSLNQLLWLVKDTSTYYVFFVALIVSFVGKNIFYLTKRTKKILLLGILIAISNIGFILATNKQAFNEYYQFLNIPKEYFKLSDGLANDPDRNLWLPPQAYVTKTFTKDMTHFPSPAFWLTKNREITYMTTNYQDFLSFIDKEIYFKKCKDKALLSWLIGVQKINVIIDNNSINNPKLGDSTTEEYISIANKCLKNLNDVYLYKSYGNMDVYKSRLAVSPEVVEFKGSIEQLDRFVKDNKVNVIYSDSGKEKINHLGSNFTVLNESFDLNWLSQENERAINRVNFSSMLFKGKGERFHYKNSSLFESIVMIEKLFVGIFFILFIIYAKKEFAKK